VLVQVTLHKGMIKLKWVNSFWTIGTFVVLMSKEVVLSSLWLVGWFVGWFVVMVIFAVNEEGHIAICR
jgi:hypothetical protein